MRAGKVDIPLQSGIVVCLLISLLLGACDAPPQPRGEPALELARIVPAARLSQGESRHLLSGVQFQDQHSNVAVHKFSAASVSLVPRGFGAFNANGINELLVENPHIEIIPTSRVRASNDEAGKVSSFADTLRSYADSLPKQFGLITRIHMRNVRITLHNNESDGTQTTVLASQLLKELGDDAQPELYDVRFLDNQSNASLRVPWARWNLETGRFIVKSDVM